MTLKVDETEIERDRPYQVVFPALGSVLRVPLFIFWVDCHAWHVVSIRAVALITASIPAPPTNSDLLFLAGKTRRKTISSKTFRVQLNAVIDPFSINLTKFYKRTNPPRIRPLSTAPGDSLWPSRSLLKPLCLESDLSWETSSFWDLEDEEDEDELERERFFLLFLKGEMPHPIFVKPRVHCAQKGQSNSISR